MAHPVSFFQIQGSDPRVLIKFYQKAFGWRGTPAPDGSSMIAAEAGGIAGAVGPSSDGSPHLAIYVTVANVTQHLARAKRAGARVAMPETRLPADLGSIGGIIDPAGNWVGLWAAPPPPPAPTHKKSAPPAVPKKPKAKAKAKPKPKAAARRAAGRKA